MDSNDILFTYSWSPEYKAYNLWSSEFLYSASGKSMLTLLQRNLMMF